LVTDLSVQLGTIAEEPLQLPHIPTAVPVPEIPTGAPSISFTLYNHLEGFQVLEQEPEATPAAKVALVA